MARGWTVLPLPVLPGPHQGHTAGVHRCVCVCVDRGGTREGEGRGQTGNVNGEGADSSGQGKENYPTNVCE